MPTNAVQAVDQSFLKTKWQAEEERLDEAQNKLDLYMDDYEDIIKDKMKKLFTTKNYDRMKYHVNQSQNILKRVVNEISTIYKVEATRQLSQENKRYEEFKQEINFDLMMKKINRYTNLLNECIVRIGIRNRQIAYDIITPNICMVIQNDEDPTQIDALIYMLTWVNTANNTEIEYHYWSVEGDYFVYDKDWKLIRVEYEGESPYKDKNGNFILPFVIFHRQEPDSTFWDQDSGRDLYNAAVLTGVKMTLFDYYFKTCSFKQIYIIGDIKDIPEDQVLDPQTALGVPAAEGANIGTLDIQANLKQLQEALVFQINGVINNYGISSDQWTLSVSEMSGRALKIRNRALLELREEQIALYRIYEKDLFEKTRIVNNAWPKLFKKIPDKIEFSIDFGEIDFPEDPEDELRLWTQKLRLGTISLGQFYMHFNPDIKDEEEAEEKIVENLKKFKEVKEENPEIDEYLNAIMRTVGIEKKEEEKEEEKRE